MAETVVNWGQLKHGDKITVDGTPATFYGTPWKYREINGQGIRVPGEVFAVADTYDGVSDTLYWSWATMLKTSAPGEYPTFRDIDPIEHKGRGLMQGEVTIRVSRCDCR